MCTQSIVVSAMEEEVELKYQFLIFLLSDYLLSDYFKSTLQKPSLEEEGTPHVNAEYS